MKRVFYLVILLGTLNSFSQSVETLESFQSIDSNIGVKIHIVKNTIHQIAISGDPEISSFIKWEVENNNLKISAHKSDLSYDAVKITIYTPSIQVLALSNGGVITMDEKFSRLQSLVISAGDRALVDLSNIEFNTLITSSDNGGQILYKAAQTVVKTSGDGSGVNINY